MRAYLDNSATTDVCKEATERMMECMLSRWANPSSLHNAGIDAEAVLNDSRRILADALGAGEDEIYFTSGGTEGNNLAIMGAALKNRRKKGRIITCATEHASVKETVEFLSTLGFDTVFLPVDKEGKADLDVLKKAVDENTICVSVMMVNNETGTVQPTEQIRKIIREKNPNTVFHVDAVQAFGKMPVKVKKLGADMVTVSSHKIHGPKGVGAIYIRRGCKISPVIHGGEQEKKIRPGTENMPGIAGFAAAAENTGDIIKNAERTAELKKRLTEGLEKTGAVVINSPADASPYILNISLPGYKSETLLNFLNAMDIYVSASSACAKGHKSHVLTAMGLGDEITDSALRISFSKNTTAEETDYFLYGINQAIEKLRKKRI